MVLQIHKHHITSCVSLTLLKPISCWSSLQCMYLVFFLYALWILINIWSIILNIRIWRPDLRRHTRTPVLEIGISGFFSTGLRSSSKRIICVCWMSYGLTMWIWLNILWWRFYHWSCYKHQRLWSYVNKILCW